MAPADCPLPTVTPPAARPDDGALRPAPAPRKRTRTPAQLRADRATAAIAGTPAASRKFGRLGPHSRLFGRGALGKVHGNTWQGRFLRSIERELLNHLGGAERASVPAKLLCARAAKVCLRLELFDRELIEQGALSDFDSKVYGALHNTFRLLIREIGLSAPPQPRKSLAEITAEIAAQREAS